MMKGIIAVILLSLQPHLTNSKLNLEGYRGPGCISLARADRPGGQIRVLLGDCQ